VDRTKVLYVMGAGRSGSTILGVTLGTCAGVFFAGELDRWLVRAGVPRRAGEPLERLWREVLADASPPAELLGGASTCLERSSALFDPRKLARRRRLRSPYLHASDALYRAVARASGDTSIVDSSHYPLRARELRALDGIDLYLIYLMRDPQQVVASLAREDVPERTFGLLAANAYLWLTNAVSAFVFLRHPRSRRLFVRYEEFIADPERVVGQILRQCQIDAAVPDFANLHTGLPFHGNRLIESETVKLGRPPSEGAHRSRFTSLAQLPWSALASRLQPAAGATRC
jgi:hypothetical protein